MRGRGQGLKVVFRFVIRDKANRLVSVICRVVMSSTSGHSARCDRKPSQKSVEGALSDLG